jgi:signal transduction histidine kinase
MMLQKLLQRPQPETIDVAPLPFGSQMWRRHMLMRWVALGAITSGVMLAVDRNHAWPYLPLLTLVIVAYSALAACQYGARRKAGGFLLEPWLYLTCSALLVFAMVLVAAPATHANSLWYNIMFFVILAEGRHMKTARSLTVLWLFCALLTSGSVLLTTPRHQWLQVSILFLTLDAGLAASATGAWLQRVQELEHNARLTLLTELEQSKTSLEEANYQLQVYAGTVEQLAVANERNRLARDLHDILGYTLATVVVKAEAAKRLIPTDPARAREELDRLQALSRDGLAEVRRSVAGLRDAAAAAGIWHEAMGKFVDGFAIETGLRIRHEFAPLPEQHSPALEMCLFRVIQESLTNVARHAHASLVTIALVVAEGNVSLTIEDDGVGTGPSASAAAGFGVRGMRERVEHLGGRLVFSSRRGEGTRVHVSVPLTSSQQPVAGRGPLPQLGDAPGPAVQDAGVDAHGPAAEASPDRLDRGLNPSLAESKE